MVLVLSRHRRLITAFAAALAPAAVLVLAGTVKTSLTAILSNRVLGFSMSGVAAFRACPGGVVLRVLGKRRDSQPFASRILHSRIGRLWFFPRARARVRVVLFSLFSFLPAFSLMIPVGYNPKCGKFYV